MTGWQTKQLCEEFMINLDIRIPIKLFGISWKVFGRVCFRGSHDDLGNQTERLKDAQEKQKTINKKPRCVYSWNKLGMNHEQFT